MGLFDSVTDSISGGAQSGYGDMQGEIQKGIDSVNSNYDQGRAYLEPYNEAGKNALNNYEDFYSQYADPGDWYNKTMSNWEMSPAAKMNQEYGLKAMNQAAAAGGTVGTPAQQMGVGKYMNDLVKGDQQNYLNNILGIGDKYGSAQGALMGQGYNSSNALLSSYMNQGNKIADLYGNMGVAKMQQSMAQGGGMNDLLGLGFDAFAGTNTGKNALNWFAGL